MDLRTAQQQELDATTGNRRIAVHQLALELLRKGSSLMTMQEAVQRARAILRAEGRL